MRLTHFKLLSFAFILSMLQFFVQVNRAHAEKPVCVDSTGEGAIIQGDYASARIEAINRAKWQALEQVAGVDVKSKTVVQDSILLNEMIVTQARGIVSNFKILKEKHLPETAQVLLNACIQPSSAESAVSPLALNSSISVFIPARSISAPGKFLYDDENILVQNIVSKLAEKGFTVRDIVDSQQPIELRNIDATLQSRDHRGLRSLIYKNLSNTVLIGKVEPVKSMSKGDSMGNGIKMPFNNITARLTYQLVSRDRDGKIIILAAGSDAASGLAPSDHDAYANALNNLSKKVIPKIMEKITARLNDIANKVTLKVQHTNNPSESLAIRDVLQKIAWVAEVEDSGIGEFIITYPENSIYLANGLSQKGFKILQFNNNSITAEKAYK